VSVLDENRFPLVAGRPLPLVGLLLLVLARQGGGNVPLHFAREEEGGGVQQVQPEQTESAQRGLSQKSRKWRKFEESVEQKVDSVFEMRCGPTLDPYLTDLID
jgi:hypothetical protein